MFNQLNALEVSFAYIEKKPQKEEFQPADHRQIQLNCFTLTSEMYISDQHRTHCVCWSEIHLLTLDLVCVTSNLKKNKLQTSKKSLAAATQIKNK